jgi:hypothetical protein
MSSAIARSIIDVEAKKTLFSLRQLYCDGKFAPIGNPLYADRNALSSKPAKHF